MGFSVGADDYIVKPFSNMELLMRVKAILRRSSGVKAPVVTEKIPFADLILDTESRSVSRQGEMIPLTYTEFRILELFVTHKKEDLFLGKYLPKHLGRGCCWRQCDYGAYQKYPQEAGG